LDETLSTEIDQKQKFVSDRGLVLTVYILYLLGFCTVITALVGLVIARVKSGSADEIWETHFQFQVRTFWIGLLCLCLSFLLMFVLVGWFLFGSWAVWTLFRVIKGMILLNDRKPIPRPASWLFG
jgi:uncharacterized membrane protein